MQNDLAASQAFQKAVDRLTRITGLHPAAMQNHRGEIWDLLWFLDACRTAAADQYRFGDGLRVTGADFESLMRRKNPRHSGYKHEQDFIRTNLHEYLPPKTWRHEPPDVARIEGYIRNT